MKSYFELNYTIPGNDQEIKHRVLKETKADLIFFLNTCRRDITVNSIKFIRTVEKDVMSTITIPDDLMVDGS